jgi:Spy/CpxP family protein refolding chaperone
MKRLTGMIVLSALSLAVLAAQPNTTTGIERQIARLTTLLSLTPAQVTQATTIFTDAANAVAPLQTALQQDRQSLQTAVTGNAATTIDSLAADIGQKTGQMIGIQGKAQAAFYAILTADQQTRLKTLHGMGFGPGGRGMGMGMGSGMPGMGTGMGPGMMGGQGPRRPPQQ